MPALRSWLTAPRRLMLSFVILLLAPAMAVVWMGVRLVEQDRALESRRLRERRESASDRLVAGLEQALSATERRLNGPPADFSIGRDDDAVIVTFGARRIEAHPREHLIYYPELPDGPTEATAQFQAGEALEYRAKDYGQAAATYRTLAASLDPAVRAGALLRLARTLRRTGATREALSAYADLAQMHDASVSRLPADLVGRRARCALLQELGRREELRAEATTLRADLVAARWPLDRGTLLAYRQQVDGWLGTTSEMDPSLDALASAVDWLWQQRTSGGLPSTGRRALSVAGSSVTIVWQARDGELAALVAGPRFQRRQWFGAVQQIDAPGFQVALAGADGEIVLGTSPADVASAVRRAAAETGLPWTIIVGDGDLAADLEGFASRRRLLLTGLAVLVGLVIAGGYLVVRAVSRELAVGRLQSDFVSAVSHEFRTPLTSLRQFTDLLNDTVEPPAAKRRAFYQAQARATDRLQRLVESLLDFGRMEAGARPYRLQPVSLAQLVQSVVDDFRREAAPEGFTVTCAVSPGGADSADGAMDADPDAIARALWNLLDNAVKYSGTGRRVSVTVGRQDGSLAITVRDEGLGIPRDEQAEIFNKFVRGAASRAHGIRGTGIGLAMVRHIVEAHGGRIHLESVPGEGSTFTIVLPLQAPDSELQAPAVRKRRSQARSPETEARSLPEARSPEPGA